MQLFSELIQLHWSRTNIFLIINRPDKDAHSNMLCTDKYRDVQITRPMCVPIFISLVKLLKLQTDLTNKTSSQTIVNFVKVT